MSDFATKLQTVRDAFAILSDSDGDIAELMADARDNGLPAHVVGQFLMEVLPIPEMGFNLEQKKFWLEVLEYIGPDFLAELSTVTAFMKKIDGFN